VIQLCQCYSEEEQSAGEVSEVVDAEREILRFLSGIEQKNRKSHYKNKSFSRKMENKKQLRMNKTDAYEPREHLEELRKYVGDEAMEMIE
jgi:hypothetical protein